MKKSAVVIAACAVAYALSGCAATAHTAAYAGAMTAASMEYAEVSAGTDSLAGLAETWSNLKRETVDIYDMSGSGPLCTITDKAAIREFSDNADSNDWGLALSVPETAAATYRYVLREKKPAFSRHSQLEENVSVELTVYDENYVTMAVKDDFTDSSWLRMHFHVSGETAEYLNNVGQFSQEANPDIQ